MKPKVASPGGAPAAGRGHDPTAEESMMNDCIRVTCRSRRAWARAARTAAAVIAAAALALVAAACGGSGSAAGSGSSPHAGGSATSRSAVGYSACMRSHGVPNYPDPSSGNTMPNGLPKVSLQQLGVTLAQFQATQRACGRLLPNGARTAQSVSQQLLSDGLQFARCMRSHGVPNWPDPTHSTPTAVALGAPPYMFHMGGINGLDGRSFPPQVTSTMTECLHLTHLTGSQVPGWSG